MIPFPNKKYQIIYADPPWKVSGWDSNPKIWTKSPGKHYKLQDLNWIKSLPVHEITAEDCILFLWVTDPILEKSFEVIKSWGFSYSTVAFTWAKTTINNKWHFGCGEWTRANPEMCLLAMKGQLKRIQNNVRQLVVERIREHSRKPDRIKEDIVYLMGDLPRIELFARIQYPGWDAWGNEVVTLEEFNKQQKEIEAKEIIDNFDLAEKLNSLDFSDLIV